MRILLWIVGFLVVTAGVVMIYDARILTNRFFGFGDINEASKGMKILGFLFAIIGALVVFFNT